MAIGRLNQREIVHHGIAVHDLRQTMAQLSETMHIDWAAPTTRHLAIWDADDQPVSFELQISWSVQGPPYYELIQGPADSVWGLPESESAFLHHIAFLSDDVRGDVERLTAAGMNVEVSARDDKGAVDRFAYLTCAWSPRIEIMTRDMLAGFQDWLAGGAPPANV